MTRFTPSRRPTDKVTPLRVINQSLAKAADGHLLSACLSLASQAETYPDVLNPAADHGSKGREEPERASFVHQFKTQLTALSGNKNPKHGFPAIVLIKEIVDSGGLKPVQQELGSWIRNLLNILKNPKDISSAALCVVTLTRIFSLSHESPELVKEFTTPVLTEYLTALLRLGSTASQRYKTHCTLKEVVQTLTPVFESLLCLIPLHPTQVRPFMGDINSMISPFLTRHVNRQEMESILASGDLTQAARQVFVSLHACTPKNKGAEAWEASLNALLLQLQHTANRVFDSIVDYAAFGFNIHDSEIARQINPALFLLKEWHTLSGGLQRLNDLVELLEVFLTSKSFVPIKLDLSGSFNTLSAILRLVVPSLDASCFKTGTNRDDRDVLILAMPVLHHSAIKTLYSIMTTFRFETSAVTDQVLDLVIWVFQIESPNTSIREACYRLTEHILKETGKGLSAETSARLIPIHQSCCDELSSDCTNVFLGPEPCTQAAEKLLIAILKYHPQEILNSIMRSRLHSTAVLTKNEEAMLAASLNSQGPSVLPFLSRQYADSSGLDALVRPQFPVLPKDNSKTLSGGTDDLNGAQNMSDEQSDDQDGKDLKKRDSNVTIKNLTESVEGSEEGKGKDSKRDSNATIRASAKPAGDPSSKLFDNVIPAELVTMTVEPTSPEENAGPTAKSPSPPTETETENSLELELGNDLGIEIASDSEG